MLFASLRLLRRRRRRGFTLIELLVVIAIIGVLVSLLLPAVQMARDAARKTQCVTNLKQLALALHNHDEAFGALPATLRPPAPGVRTGWAIRAMPFLDRSQLYDAYNFTRGWNNAENTSIVGTRVNFMVCPSSPAPVLDGDPTVSGYPSSWIGFAAPSDYGVIYGVEQWLYDAGLVDTYGAGMMPRDASPRLREVTDGLSKTILLGESAGRPTVYRKGGVPFGVAPIPANDPATYSKVNGGGWCRPASDWGLDGSSADGSTFPGPCAINCTNGQNMGTTFDPVNGLPASVGPYRNNGTSEFYSFHSGGAHVAFGDGSANFISEDVDIRIFARLVTRASGESTSEAAGLLP